MSMIEELQQLKVENKADIIKIYFVDEDHYRVKIIRDGVIIKKIGKGIMPAVDVKKKD